MNRKGMKKFSYFKPGLVDMKKQKAFAACSTGGQDTQPSCGVGNGANASCGAGIGFGVDLCQNGGSTSSGSHCDEGTTGGCVFGGAL